MMRHNLSPPGACLFDGQLLNMTEMMQPSLYVLYIFAGSTSHAGLSGARLTRSFCRTQQTELKEKSLCGKLHAKLNMQSLTLTERINDPCLFLSVN